MKPMQLANEWLPQNVGRPKDRFDFDLMIGSHKYQHGKDTPDGSIWVTSLTNNLMGLVVSIILWPIAIYVAVTDLGFSDMAWWLQFVLVIFAVIGGLAVLMMTAMVFYRRRLIVDHRAEELRFCCWTNKPYFVLPLKDIRGMSFENIQHVSGSDGNDHTATTPVLVAELRDGRIASIAFWPAKGLFQAITGLSGE